MGKVFDKIDEKITDWVEAQKMFFVATAPLAGNGFINCSPKGMDTFRILGEREIAYLDYAGSGVETIAHLKENSRICIMMCALDGPPKIFRFHGKGTVHEKGTAAYARFAGHFDDHPGTRAIIHVELDRISDSCGFGVPLYDFQGDRDQLHKWAEKHGEQGVREYCGEKNLRSLDGLPGMDMFV